MLRYAVSAPHIGRSVQAKRNRILASHTHWFPLVNESLGTASPSTSTGSTSIVRYQTSGQPNVQTEGRSGEDHASRPAADSSSTTTTNSKPTNTTLRRPSVLQSLKVQANPISNQVTGNFGNNAGNRKPPPKRGKQFGNFDSTKLKSLLRNGPSGYSKNNNALPNPKNHPNRNRPFPPLNRTAMQSNLQPSSGQSTGAKPRSPDLVQFFQNRLQEARQDSAAAANKLPGNSAPTKNQPPPFRGPQAQQQPPTTSPGGLSAALAQAKTWAGPSPAYKNKPPGNQSTVQDMLDRSPSGTTTTNNTAASTDSDKENPELASPLRQFILEMQKKKLHDAKDAAPAAAAARENTRSPTRSPTWRERLRSENVIDPLFVHQQQQQQQQQSLRPEEDEDQRILDNLLNDLHGSNVQEVEQKASTRTNNNASNKPREIILPWNDITVRELSQLFGKKVDRIMKCLQDLGESATDDDAFRIDSDLAEMVALELDIQFTRPSRRPTTRVNDLEQLMERRKANEISAEVLDDAAERVAKAQPLAPRPPVVCIMGHVDHGKTTLMDALRRRAIGGGTKTKKKGKKDKKKGAKKSASGSGDVAGTEAGGITQVITAFQVPLADPKDTITFLDTPGHAAFSAMRQSSSHAADILVLVIAADDGVSPQTVEILNFYKSIVKDSNGGISMVVAMNKIDKPGVDADESRRRIENQLLEHGIIPEGVGSHSDSDFGSPVQFVPISAKTGQGLDDLIESLSLQSEVMDLQADDKARAEGIVMDARVEQGLGVVVDCIVRWGSVQPGDVVVSGTNMGKVRILKDVNDKSIKKGTPSQPVRVVGFRSTPKAGDPMICVASEEVANDLVERRLAQQNKNLSPTDANSNFSQVIISGRESMTSMGTERRLQRYDLSLETDTIRIPVIVKAKADGSVAAVRDSLKMLGNESSFDLDIDIIGEGVGPLTQSEINMAKESNAAVFCFDVRNQDKGVMAEAEASEVAIHEYDVIYSLLDDAKEVFSEYLPAVPFETVHGRAKVQEVFSISGGKQIVAGLKVLDGNLHKSTVTMDDSTAQVFYRVLRNDERMTPEGEQVRASSLRKFKENVESVRNGEECGLSLTDVEDFKPDDIIECYSVEMKKSFV